MPKPMQTHFGARVCAKMTEAFEAEIDALEALARDDPAAYLLRRRALYDEAEKAERAEQRACMEKAVRFVGPGTLVLRLDGSESTLTLAGSGWPRHALVRELTATDPKKHSDAFLGEICGLQSRMSRGDVRAIMRYAAKRFPRAGRVMIVSERHPFCRSPSPLDEEELSEPIFCAAPFEHDDCGCWDKVHRYAL